MFEFNVSKDMNKTNETKKKSTHTHNDKQRIPICLLAYLLTLIVKGLKVSVQLVRVVTS